jgi:hypothetical protein
MVIPLGAAGAADHDCSEVSGRPSTTDRRWLAPGPLPAVGRFVNDDLTWDGFRIHSKTRITGARLLSLARAFHETPLVAGPDMRSHGLARGVGVAEQHVVSD